MRTLILLVAALSLAALTFGCTSRSEAPKPGAPSASKSQSGESAIWFEGTFEEALAQGKASNKLVFVDFWTSWCGYCKKLDKVTFSQPAVQAELGKMVSIKIDAESKAGAPVAAKFRVSGYPALLVLDGNGKEVGRIAGFLEPEPFLAKLEEIRARAKPR